MRKIQKYNRFFGGQAPLRMTKQTNCHCERSVPQATPTGGPVRDERSEHAISDRLPRAHALAKTETGQSVFSSCHPCVGGDLSGSLRNRFPVKRGMTGAISFCHSYQAQRERESMPRQARHDTFGQMGRSMVEMLGVLAVMGIVGLVGIRMYNIAMNKHRANELIYEAQKRATMVAAQIMAGRDKNALSIAEFLNPTGYTFGVEKNLANPNQFNITLDAVPADVCAQMKNAVGPGTVARVISQNCNKLTFNNDLSKTAYASDNQTETACANLGFYWYKDLCYTDFCATCRANQICMDIGEEQKCVTKCPNDATINADGTCPNNTCSSNENCLTEGTYCKITSATYTGVARACYTDLSGTCTNIGAVTPYDLDEKILGYPLRAYKSTRIVPNWWTANNWCQAQGKRLFSVEDLDCYYGETHPSYEGTFWCCAQGKSCGYNAAEETFPPMLQALRKESLSRYMWLSTPSSVETFGDDNGCYAHYYCGESVSIANARYKRDKATENVYCRDL